MSETGKIVVSEKEKLTKIGKKKVMNKSSFHSAFSISSILSGQQEVNKTSSDEIEKCQKVTSGLTENKVKKIGNENTSLVLEKRNSADQISASLQIETALSSSPSKEPPQSKNFGTSTTEVYFNNKLQHQSDIITTSTANSINSLLIPVSSLPSSIIAALPADSLKGTFSILATNEPFESIHKTKLDKKFSHSIVDDVTCDITQEKRDIISDVTPDLKQEVKNGDISSDSETNDDDVTDDVIDDDDEYEEDSSDGSGRKKKTRTVFSRTQVCQLETMFDMKRYLSSSERATLARDLGLSEQQIKIWFQNRRNKLKRQIKTGIEMAGNISAGTVPPPNVNAALLNSLGSHTALAASSNIHSQSLLPSNLHQLPFFTGSNPSQAAGQMGSHIFASNLPGSINFNSGSPNSINPSKVTHLNSHPLFKTMPPFGSQSNSSLLQHPSLANQSRPILPNNPFSSGGYNTTMPSATSINNTFSYSNLQLFKSLSGLV